MADGPDRAEKAQYASIYIKEELQRGSSFYRTLIIIKNTIEIKWGITELKSRETWVKTGEYRKHRLCLKSHRDLLSIKSHPQILILGTPGALWRRGERKTHYKPPSASWNPLPLYSPPSLEQGREHSWGTTSTDRPALEWNPEHSVYRPLLVLTLPHLFPQI